MAITRSKAKKENKALKTAFKKSEKDSVSRTSTNNDNDDKKGLSKEFSIKRKFELQPDIHELECKKIKFSAEDAETAEENTLNDADDNFKANEKANTPTKTNPQDNLSPFCEAMDLNFTNIDFNFIDFSNYPLATLTYPSQLIDNDWEPSVQQKNNLTLAADELFGISDY